MQSLFVAKGPSFSKGIVFDEFKSVELYNLMCRILNIKPSPNNGTDYEKRYWFLPVAPIDKDIVNPVKSTEILTH
jgi:hypothetical protein